MKAQLSRILESPSPDGDPVSPIIVKIGGGSGEEELGGLSRNQVSIESEMIPFDDSTANIWTTAWSSLPGRIYGVAFRESGRKPVFCAVDPTPDLLTSLSLVLDDGTGNAVFMVSEGFDETGQIRLNVTSPTVTFDVVGPPDEVGWTESQGMLTVPVNSAIFSQSRISGNDEPTMALYYLFNSAEITVSIDYHPVIS